MWRRTSAFLLASLLTAVAASADSPDKVSDPAPDPAPVAASPGLGEALAAAELPSPASDGLTCPAQHGAAAYVCCDGEGGFTVCRGRSGGDRLLLGCIDRHEEDHLAWFAEHLPEVCLARPRGACRFEMTPRQFQELECNGYMSEFRCLRESRGRTAGRSRSLGEVMWRQRQLVKEAEGRFACATGGW